MAASPVVVFQALDQQPAADLVAEIKKQEGFQRALFGRKLEDPDTGVLYTEWSTAAAALTYRSSQLASSLAAAGKENETLVFNAPGDWAAVLAAPCTEVFTSFGVEEGFAANAVQFTSSLDANPPEGYKGAAFGEGIVGGEGQDRTARMVLGWTSREAHYEAKGKPGALQDNIHLVRVLRREVDLFHVEFQAL